MNDEPFSDGSSLPVCVLERIDRACLAFESGWRAQQAPRIEEFLGTAEGTERSELLRELLLLELDYRVRRDEHPTPEEYQARFPQDSRLISHIFGQGSTQSASSSTTPSERLDVSRSPSLPITFGGYELLEVLGQGGMGIVYRARQHDIGRVVALKIVRPDQLASVLPERRQAALQRFHAEIQAAACLEHAHIVPVYEVGQIGEQPYFSMRYIQGQTLDERLQAGPLDGRAAAELLIPLARAVHFAHRHGVLHRDLKPRNVLIDAAGQPFVTDFGLARTLEADSHLTQSGEILGTPSYMSPEQASGAAELSFASDIYSLGATLYELIAGRPPFCAASVAETLRQVIHEEAVPPRRLNAAIERDLETICLRCLRKDARQRFQTAADLADELGRYRRGEPILSRPISVAARTVAWCRRNPQQAGLILAVTAVLMLGTVVSSAFALRNRRLADAEIQLRLEAVEAERRQKQLTDQARQDRDQAMQNAFLADMRLADRALEVGQHGRVEDLLLAHVPRAGQRDLRCWVWYWHLARSRQQVMRLQDRGAPIRDLRITLDGGRIGALIGPMFRGWETDTAEVQLDWTDLEDPWRFAWSPDGSRAAIVNPQTLTMYNVADRSICWQGKYGGCVFWSLSWSPTGDWLASPSENRTVSIWDAATGQQSIVIEVPDHPLAVDWRPTGDRLAIACRKHLLVWDLPERRFLADREFPGWEGPFTVAWSPDGQRIAYGAGHADFPVEIWDTGRDVVQTLRGHLDDVSAVIWSPDGRQLASASFDRTVRIWDTTEAKLVRILDGHPRRVTHLAWSTDERQLYSASDDGVINVWQYEQMDSPAAILSGHEGGVERIKWSPDGMRLASSGLDRSVFVWDVSTRRRVIEIQRPGAPGESSGRVAWRPDGQQLAVTELAADAMKMEIVLYDGQLGERQTRLADVPFLTDEIEWSPDGRFVAASGESSSVLVFDASSGAEVHCWPVSAPRVVDLAWSPGGQFLAICGQANALQVWDVETGQLHVKLGQRSGETQDCVCWSPDGGSIASASSEGVVQIWDLASATLRRELWGHRGGVVAVDWSPDGRLLASGGKDGEVRVWSVAAAAELLTLAAHDRCVRSVAWSPDGRRLASGGWDDTVRVWDATHGYSLAGCAAAPASNRISSDTQDVLADYTPSQVGSMSAEALSDDSLPPQGAAVPGPSDVADDGLADLARAVRENPLNPELRQRLALLYASQGNWSMAADVLEATAELHPVDPMLRMQVAASLVAAGRDEDYRNWTAQMLADFPSAADAGKTVKACLLTPRPVGDLQTLVSLADAAVAQSGPNLLAWRQLTRSLAAYRAEDYRASLSWASRARSTDPNPPASLLATALLLESMSQHGLGESAAASASLLESQAVASPHAGAECDVATDWQNWLIYRLIGREAEVTRGP